jgi:hypothetical protein
MRTDNTTPEKMQIICNIQTIREKTGGNREFNALNKLSIDELRELQDVEIINWNNTFTQN